jgi:hypothetical protein
VQVGSHVLNARAFISKTLDVRAIMSLRDMWAGSKVNVYKTSRHTATVQLQCIADLVSHS